MAYRGRPGGSGGGLTQAQVLDLIRANMDADLPFAGLTGLSIVDALTGTGQVVVNDGLNLVQLRITPAQYRLLKPSLSVGNSFKLKQGGSALIDTTITRFEEFDESAAADTLDISLSSVTYAPDGGDLPLTGAEVEIGDADASLWNSYVDGRAEANFDAKVDGEKFEASDGFEFVASPSDIQAGKVWVETGAGADDMTTRARDADGADTLAGKIHPGTLLLYGDIASSYALIRIASVGAVTGSGADRVFNFTFSDHRAVGTLTGDQPLRIFPDLPSALKDIIAPRSVPPWALDPGSGTAGQVLGVKGNGDIGLIRDQHSVLDSVSIPKGTGANAGSISLTTSFQVLPRYETGGSDANGEVSAVLANADDEFQIRFDSVAGSLGVNTWSDPKVYRGDVKVEAKYGDAAWTELTSQEYAIFALQGQNVNATYIWSDTPGAAHVGKTIKYRFSWKYTAHGSGAAQATDFQLEGGTTTLLRARPAN